MTSVGTLDAAAVWTGRPGGGIRFQRGDIFLVPFSVVWAGIVFSAGWQMFRGSFAFPDIVLLFMMIVGVYVTVGRFIVDVYVRSQTSYVLTDDSAIIRGPFGRQTTVYLPSVSNLNMSLANDGSGSIYFGDPPSLWSGGAGWGSGYGKASPAFLYIDHVADVFERCKQMQRQRG